MSKSGQFKSHHRYEGKIKLARTSMECKGKLKSSKSYYYLLYIYRQIHTQTHIRIWSMQWSIGTHRQHSLFNPIQFFNLICIIFIKDRSAGHSNKGIYYRCFSFHRQLVSRFSVFPPSHTSWLMTRQVIAFFTSKQLSNRRTPFNEFFG